jgi:hypothetical protein
VTSPGAGPTGEGPTGTGSTEPEPPEKPAFTPDDPLRAWVAGDSLVITPGYAVYRALGRNDAVKQAGDVEGASPPA